MNDSDKELRSLEELGHWEGMTFIFAVPVELANGTIIKAINCDGASLPDGITPDDVVTAIGNNVAAWHGEEP